MKMNINPFYYQGIFKIIQDQANHIIRLKEKPIIIAIDGHSSCGKSTLSKDLASVLSYRHIDTGAMYRAVTLAFLDGEVDIESEQEVIDSLKNIKVDFERIGDQNCTLLNGANIENQIRGLRVSRNVSEVAANSHVRRFLVQQQQMMGLQKAIVMDGRDIGTVVFPNAELKIFMTASIEIRAQRRYLEMKKKGATEDFDQIAANLAHRDHIDSTREDSPLLRAEDAKIIDTSDLTREDQLSLALNLAIKSI